MFINYQPNALIITMNICFCTSELPALLVIALNFYFYSLELPALIKWVISVPVQLWNLSISFIR